MKKSKILISAVTMFSLCITPMSVYAQVDPNSNIENTISQTKSQKICQHRYFKKKKSKFPMEQAIV